MRGFRNGEQALLSKEGDVRVERRQFKRCPHRDAFRRAFDALVTELGRDDACALAAALAHLPMRNAKANAARARAEALFEVAA